MAKSSKTKPSGSPARRPADGGILTTDYVVSGWKVSLLQAALIVAAGLWVFSPAFHGDWLWDDDLYFTHNPLLHDPARLWKAWFQPGSFIEYYPIEETVQWVQWQLWGNDTFGYHLTNVALHLLSALLVWRLLRKFGLPLAWLGGLLFAIHPVMVESVAWISELKNTLSLPPFLLAMCAWIDYEEHHRPRDYGLALGLFLVAMLCKITMAPFPVVILLYAWWKRGRIGWPDLRASAPFFAIALVLGLATIKAGAWYLQHRLEIAAVVPIGGLGAHLALAGTSLAFYFSKVFLPVELLPIYPQWKIDPPALWQFLPWPVLAGVIGWLWTRRAGWGRHVLLGLGFFLLTLAPFLGFDAISYMSFTWVMDHFLYLPIIGLIGLIVAGIGAIDRSLSTAAHPYSTGLVTLVMALLAFHSHWYANAFTNDETFWSYTLDRNPQAWMAHNNLGKDLLLDGRPEEAKTHFEAAIRLKPDFAEAYGNLGSALVQMDRIPYGIVQFRKALSLDPKFAVVHNNLGVVLAQTGQLPEAQWHLEAAIQLKPDYAEAHNNLGNILLLAGKVPEAGAQYEQALKLDPDYAEAYSNLGHVLLLTGHPSEAMPDLDQAVKLAPNDLATHNLLGQALRQVGRIPEAIAQFQIVLQINPQDPTARSSLKQLQKAQPGAPGK